MNSSKKKILIVEDELAYAKLLTSQLTAKGYDIITAKDGEEGLKKAETQQPDLILLDIRMPRMDGMAVLAHLKKSGVASTAKIIMLTNLEPNEEIIQKVISDLPSYYFVKSNITLDELIEKITHLLNDEPVHRKEAS